MKGKKILFSLVAMLTIGVLAGCSSANNTSGSSNTTGSKPLDTVRIAYFPNITHSQALVGMQNGQFQKDLGSTKIEWKQFNAGPSEIEAFLSGAVDIGYIGPGPAINGYTKSKGDLQIIAGATDAGAVLIGKKDSAIKSVKDLSGKKVAIPQFGNTQDLCLRFLLQENGLKDTTKGGTVQIVQADNPDIVSLLDKGSIDAALVPEPWGATIQAKSGASIILDYNQIWKQGKYSTAVVVARKEFIKDHPDVVEKFLKTHVELTDYLNKSQTEASTKVNDELNTLTKKPLDKSVLDTAFKRLTVTVNPETEATKEMIDMSVKAGFIKEKPDDKGLFDLTILNKVLKAKGEKTIN
ncbi:aliphatic sulfonate ABC transporter substrate-binding protein [Clostridium pasteurianum]|uniref:ABC transporter, substrate-binding protein, aliphatic sulfonates family n=1 Tax=Clostridium pasteurianum BC1 TaxID=86416 RepID=R4K7B4_CLOPA|nr:aliphatic sulfonate ABC transporter substrate-binding protein [Clostridium pasteurianum]AGK99062.1 ABC transporter, substrate-binding protein, aliphatic sulfonates family [Clostridium pasteurianum BC1]